MKTTKKIHYSWIIVFVGFLLSFFVTTLNSSIYSLMIVPVCEEFGIPRAEFSLAKTYGAIASMVVAFFVGRIYQKFSLKKSVMAGVILASISFVLQGFSPNICFFHIMAAVYGISVSLATTIATSTLINNWFEEKHGIALAVVAVGSGFGGMLLNPLIGHMISNIGWRSSFFALAAVAAVILVPAVGFLLKEKPSDIGLRPYGSEKHKSVIHGVSNPDSETGMAVAEAVKTPLFYCMAFMCLVAYGSANGILLHTVAYATDIGFDYTKATFIATLITAGTIISKLVMGKVFDKLGGRKASSLCFLSYALCAFLYFAAEGRKTMLILAALVFGFGSCFTNIAPAIITKDIFGRKHFASLFGKWQMFGSLGTAIISPFIGAIYDHFGSYQPAWAILAIIMALCVGITNLLFMKSN